MFNSIVVGFDGSQQSSRGLQMGATLAAQEQSGLGIVFIIDDAHMQHHFRTLTASFSSRELSSTSLRLADTRLMSKRTRPSLR